MSLSVGLDVALSGLSTTAEQTAVVSRNVARANDPYATRKTANVVTTANGGIRVSSVTRAANTALLEKMLSATSTSAAQKAIVEALNRLDETVADPELDTSPAAMIQKLNDAIQQYAAAPQDPLRAQSAVAAAQNLADTLNGATRDGAGCACAGRRRHCRFRQSPQHPARALRDHQHRDRQGHAHRRRCHRLPRSARCLACRASPRMSASGRWTRANGDMAVFTDSGVTLFDVKARSVTFDRTLLYAPGTTGNAVYVDGVPIAGGAGVMLAGSGRLTGLTAVRDNIAVTYQNQLDEIARGLIEAFAESDQSATPSLPDAPGAVHLSRRAGDAGVRHADRSAWPARFASTRASIPTQGGNLALLRDGGMAGDPAYVYNASGGSGLCGSPQSVRDRACRTTRSFDPAVQLLPTATLGGFASSSAAWLQETRKFANDNSEYADTLLQRSSEALSKETGVNIDEEMTSLLELERAYQASTRLITTIDNMMKSLLAAAG